MYTLLDGKAVSAKLRGKIKENVEKYKNNNGKDIGLAVVMVGENPASAIYVRNKIKACEEVGIKSFSYYLPEKASQNDVDRKSVV